MLEKATRLCEASFGTLLLLEGESFRRVARHNAPAKYAEFTDKNPLIRYRESRSLNRLIETKQPVHTTDMMVEEPETADSRIVARLKPHDRHNLRANHAAKPNWRDHGASASQFTRRRRQ